MVFLFIHKKKLIKFSFFLFILFLVFIPVFFLKAQTADELNSKISQKNQDIAKLEEEIRVYQDQLNTLSRQKNSLNGSIQALDITHKKLVADIAVTQNKIDKTNFKIESLSSQITTKEEAIITSKNAIALEIKQTNEFELNNMVEILQSEHNFSSVWKDID